LEGDHVEIDLVLSDSVVLDDNVASAPRPPGDESPRYWTAPHKWGLGPVLARLIGRCLLALRFIAGRSGPTTESGRIRNRQEALRGIKTCRTRR
jgi:hypothetical protein